VLRFRVPLIEPDVQSGGILTYFLSRSRYWLSGGVAMIVHGNARPLDHELYRDP